MAGATTWMSEAAAGICRLKCFCLCFCWTFRAKPEPRIPWEGTEARAQGRTRPRLGPAHRTGSQVTGSGRLGLLGMQTPRARRAPLASLPGQKAAPAGRG